MAFLIFLCVFDIIFASSIHFDPELTFFLEKMKKKVIHDGPTCFISRAHTGESDEILQYHKIINEGLQRGGIKTYFDLNKGNRGLNIGDSIESFLENINTVHFVLCLFTPRYKERSKIESSGVAREVTLIADRLSRSNKKFDVNNNFLIPLILENNVERAVPDILRKRLVADHQEKDLKKIFKDIFIHLYIFYFKENKDFNLRRCDFIKKEIENFFKISLSTHSSLDTDGVQTQIMEALDSPSVSLTQYTPEDNDMTSKLSKFPYVSSPMLISSPEDCFLKDQSQPTESLPLLQERQHSAYLVSEESFLLPQYVERKKRPRSPC